MVNLFHQLVQPLDNKGFLIGIDMGQDDVPQAIKFGTLDLDKYMPSAAHAHPKENVIAEHLSKV